eukprot:361516-Rhodomonas_salina.2
MAVPGSAYRARSRIGGRGLIGHEERLEKLFHSPLHDPSPRLFTTRAGKRRKRGVHGGEGA